MDDTLAANIVFAEPWWVNLLIVLPIVAYGYWRHQGLSLSIGTLFVAACFAAAFGFVEAAVVIYLRAAIGLLPGFRGTLANVSELSTELGPSADLLVGMPPSLLAVEVIREAATMVMLISVALLITRPRRNQCAAFLWTFAIWDISYYVGLWATIGWPSSLLTHDVLFLIPVAWFSQVWLPLLVSLLTVLAVLGGRKQTPRAKAQL